MQALFTRTSAIAWKETEPFKIDSDVSDLAPYGLRDGMRYLFPQAEDEKIIFDRSAYPYQEIK